MGINQLETRIVYSFIAENCYAIVNKLYLAAAGSIILPKILTGPVAAALLISSESEVKIDIDPKKIAYTA